MTAPFGEELATATPTQALDKRLKILALSPRRYFGRKFGKNLVQVLTVGKKRRWAWLGTSHRMTFSNELVRAPRQFLLGQSNFACGVIIPSGELVIRLQYARDAERRFMQRYWQDVRYRWQRMPLEWLSPEEVTALSASLDRLSSEARAS